MPDLETPVETPVAPVEDTGTLADHEKQFGPKADHSTAVPARDDVAPAVSAQSDTTDTEDVERDVKGRFTKGGPRHHAKKDQATPADVPRIQQLATEKRAEESRAKLLEDQIAELRTKIDAKPVTPTVSDTFTDPEPQIADFKDETDPYAAYVRNLARWDRRKELHDERAAQQTESAKTQQADVVSKYQARATEFAKAHPDFEEKLKDSPKENLSPLLMHALIEDDNGPAFVYHLAQTPDLLYELHLLTDGKDNSPTNRHIVRQLLGRRIQSVETGSDAAPVSPTPVAPRPLNPVRTGPTKPDAVLPGDASPLRDHEKAFHQGRRR